MTFAIGLFCGALYPVEVSFYSLFTKSLNHEWLLDFIECLAFSVSQ